MTRNAYRFNDKLERYAVKLGQVLVAVIARHEPVIFRPLQFFFRNSFGIKGVIVNDARDGIVGSELFVDPSVIHSVDSYGSRDIILEIGLSSKLMGEI